MIKTMLGRNGLEVNKDGFGALPMQRISFAEAGAILNRALDAGINFIDTARVYSDSEEKIGESISSRRSEYILATKTGAATGDEAKKHLDTSLKNLKTDHVDIYQFHNPKTMPRPDDGSGLYEAALEAKAAGKIRFISITNHRLAVAKEAVESGLYDTLQFPFNYLAHEKDIELVRLAERNNVGFIAMKALSGGLITDVAASRAWLASYRGVVPIWGIQRMSEMEALIDAMNIATNGEETLTPAQNAKIESDRAELAGNFCRGCGYCMPCPTEIEINTCARMSLFLRRSPPEQWLTPFWQAEMEKIASCLHCNSCKEHCPYGLDTPTLLAANLEDYKRILADRSLAA
jgi:aryl-alcohol dehydrogenase-like predicted oxidoreductase